jgi:type III secretion protein Q
VALVGPAGRLWIDDGGAFLHALTGIALDDGEGPTEGAARAAWLDTRQWLAGAASAALAATGWPVRDHIELVDHAPGPATSPDAEKTDGRAPLRRLQLQLRTEDHVFTTHGWSEDAAWVDRLRDATPMTGRARLDDAVVQAAVVVARHRLRRGALRALRPGSLIRPTQAWPVDGRGPWRLGAIRWQTRLTGQGLELEKMMDDTAYDPTDPLGDPFDSAAPEGVGAFDAAGADATTEAWNDTPAELGTLSSPAIDELPITLQFEAGQIRLTVAQAARLAPGAVLGLQETPGPAQVLIRAGGVALGTGELVEVDGRLAVQILRWTGAAATEIAP